jgi:3-oxoacyl-[acyl-carrier protein] reductase
MSKQILLLGGSGDIGQAIAKSCKELGDYITVIDKVPPCISDDFLSLDLIDDGTIVEKFSKFLVGKEDFYDTFISAVGIYRHSGIDEFSWLEWEEYLQVNCRAPLKLEIEWIRTVKNKNKRTIVNIISAGATLGTTNLSYATSKAALEGATRSLAHSLGKENFRVFGINPGIIETKMSATMPEHRINYHLSKTILKRLGRPDEVADLISFLLHQKSDYMTGSIINLSCGLLS